MVRAAAARHVVSPEAHTTPDQTTKAGEGPPDTSRVPDPLLVSQHTLPWAGT